MKLTCQSFIAHYFGEIKTWDTCTVLGTKNELVKVLTNDCDSETCKFQTDCAPAYARAGHMQDSILSGC